MTTQPQKLFTPKIIAELHPDDAAWLLRTAELVPWFARRFVTRLDAWGGYTPDGVMTCPPKEQRGVDFLDLYKLERHCSASAVEHRGRIIGTHTATQGPNSRCKTIDDDIDAHDPSASPELNEAYAIHQFNKLSGMGFRPLLLDSDGMGGFHVRTLLSKSIPLADAYNAGRWLSRDAADFGLPNLEVFPKQSKLGGPGESKPYGGWLRLPGKHHKRNVWSKVWNGSIWLVGNAAIDYMLALTGDDPALIPQEAIEYSPPSPAKVFSGVTITANPHISADGKTAIEKYGLVALELECQKASSAAPGNRHRTLCACAFRLGQLIPDSLTESQIIQPLLDAIAAAGAEDLTLAKRTIIECLAAGQVNPRPPRPANQFHGCDPSILALPTSTVDSLVATLIANSRRRAAERRREAEAQAQATRDAAALQVVTLILASLRATDPAAAAIFEASRTPEALAAREADRKSRRAIIAEDTGRCERCRRLLMGSIPLARSAAMETRCLCYHCEPCFPLKIFDDTEVSRNAAFMDPILIRDQTRLLGSKGKERKKPPLLVVGWVSSRENRYIALVPNERRILRRIAKRIEREAARISEETKSLTPGLHWFCNRHDGTIAVMSNVDFGIEDFDGECVAPSLAADFCTNAVSCIPCSPDTRRPLTMSAIWRRKKESTSKWFKIGGLPVEATRRNTIDAICAEDLCPDIAIRRDGLSWVASFEVPAVAQAETREEKEAAFQKLLYNLSTRIRGGDPQMLDDAMNSRNEDGSEFDFSRLMGCTP